MAEQNVQKEKCINFIKKIKMKKKYIYMDNNMKSGTNCAKGHVAE